MSDIPKEMVVSVCIDKKASGGHATRAPRGTTLFFLTRVAATLFCISTQIEADQSPADENAIFAPRGQCRQERDPNRGVRHRVRLTRKSIPRQFSLIRAAQQSSFQRQLPPPTRGWHNIHKGRKLVRKRLVS
jgi:hypothetical protein